MKPEEFRRERFGAAEDILIAAGITESDGWLWECKGVSSVLVSHPSLQHGIELYWHEDALCVTKLSDLGQAYFERLADARQIIPMMGEFKE